MSRFPELFEEAIEGVVADDAFLDRGSRRARRDAGSSSASTRSLAEVHIRARYPYERTTPVTGLVDAGDGVADRHRRRVAARRAPHRRRRGGRHQRLPVRAGARPRPRVGAAARGRLRARTTSSASSSSSRSRRTTSAARERCYVGTSRRVNAERLVELVEASMSSPIYELLKRPDELFVVEHAHLQPRFVEDSVRVALKSVLDELPDLDDGDFVLSRQVNFETIHAHEVVAERYGTVGELRARARGRRATARCGTPSSATGCGRLAGLPRPRRRSVEAVLLAAHEPPDVRAVQHDARRRRRRRRRRSPATGSRRATPRAAATAPRRSTRPTRSASARTRAARRRRRCRRRSARRRGTRRRSSRPSCRPCVNAEEERPAVAEHRRAAGEHAGAVAGELRRDERRHEALQPCRGRRPASPSLRPCTRQTFVAPMLPLPCVRMSSLRKMRTSQ